MVKRRARQAGVQTAICNHSFRGTGITTYLENGGELEKAAHMANHSSTRTTQLYDRRADEGEYYHNRSLVFWLKGIGSWVQAPASVMSTCAVHTCHKRGWWQLFVCH